MNTHEDNFAGALPADEVTALGLLAQKPSRELWRSLRDQWIFHPKLRRIADLLIQDFENPGSLSLEDGKELEEFKKIFAE